MGIDTQTIRALFGAVPTPRVPLAAPHAREGRCQAQGQGRVHVLVGCAARPQAALRGSPSSCSSPALHLRPRHPQRQRAVAATKTSHADEESTSVARGARGYRKSVTLLIIVDIESNISLPLTHGTPLLRSTASSYCSTGGSVTSPWPPAHLTPRPGARSPTNPY